MPELLISDMNSTAPTWSISFGWMGPGDKKIIRKVFTNVSHTDKIFGLSMKPVRTPSNSMLVDNGAISTRKYGDDDWVLMLNGYIYIGDMQPRESIIYDVRMIVPQAMPVRGKYYVNLMLRYL